MGPHSSVHSLEYMEGKKSLEKYPLKKYGKSSPTTYKKLYYLETGMILIIPPPPQNNTLRSTIISTIRLQPLLLEVLEWKLIVWIVGIPLQKGSLNSILMGHLQEILTMLGLEQVSRTMWGTSYGYSLGTLVMRETTQQNLKVWQNGCPYIKGRIFSLW